MTLTLASVINLHACSGPAGRSPSFFIFLSHICSVQHLPCLAHVCVLLREGKAQPGGVANTSLGDGCANPALKD